jgi:hypothetical protein
VDEAQRGCARAGIKFKTLDLLPCYQDEDEPEPAEEDEYDDEEGEDEELEGGVEDEEAEEELELEEEDEASEYYYSGGEDVDPEREARRPKSFEEFLERLGEDHGHSMDDLFYAYHEDRWDEYLF